MQFTTPMSPHISGNAGVNRVMRDVIVALIPGTLLYCVLFSWSVLLNIVIALVFATAAESAVSLARKKPVFATFPDLSAVVTAWLFALALPPLLPWWATASGIVFAIVIAKQLYGGLGYNPFNPAMAGYVMLLVSFPKQMTAWLPPVGAGFTSPTLTDTLLSIAGSAPIDAFTQATPLDGVKTHLSQNGIIAEIANSPLFGTLAGAGWEWVNLAWLAGGLWLLHRRVISWHIPAGLLGSLALIAAAFYISDTDTHLSPVFHILSGATLLGAFFIATDPVTAPASRHGQLMFAAAIGVLTFIIRGWGGYPDGVAFAVLLMNMVTPTIDYFYRPKVFGQR